MIINLFALMALGFPPGALTPSFAATLPHEHLRVTPSNLLIPMGDNVGGPIPPDKLRATSPWTESLFGDWRFQLTHGEIVEGHFSASRAEQIGLRASSSQGGNPVGNAFDGRLDSRWCADGPAFPQWLQARLDASRQVIGVDIAWERPNARYQCRIEGSNDGSSWQTLVDHSAEPGIGDAYLPVSATAPRYRFVRMVVLGATGGSWASVREMRISYRSGTEALIWHPKSPSDAAPSHADDFVSPSFDDRKWDHLTVPSNWEMAGFSIPTYNSVDDTVGLYRRWVGVPASWWGRRIYWRFDGVLDGAEIYVNGKRAGYHESGYTSFDVDLTGLIQPGKSNLLAVRVCKTTPSVEAETGDYQCMGGIFRDTRLIAVPKTHVADLSVRTPLSRDYKDATLEAGVNIAGVPGETVEVIGHVTDASTLRRTADLPPKTATIGPDGEALVNLSQPVQRPRLWSAESPALYFLTLEIRRNGSAVERVEQRFGFRQVSIIGNVVHWNGQPIKCMGVCRHDFWPDKGFALTDAEWIKDLNLMKATNINAIRTSHYNHAARFLELCDERGFYILDEVPFCWVDDRVKDPSFAPPLLQRAAETVARDKNRPCVLAWSLGNENPIGVDTQAVHDLVARLDPTRPSFASGGGPNSVKGQELFDTHYPSPEGIRNYVKRDSGIAPLVITEHPHTFFSRETQSYDPGASDVWSEGLISTWDLLWKSPTILGSFIWEWQSQGIADKFPDHTTDFYFGQDHMRQENNKGIMDAFRDPKPEQWIVKMVYSPVQFPTRTLQLKNGFWEVPIVNRYAFTDLGELSFRWTAFLNGTVLERGVSRITCAPGQSVRAKFAAPPGLTSLQIEAVRGDEPPVTLVRLASPTAPTADAPAGFASAESLSVTEGVKELEVKSSTQSLVFDKESGALVSWVVAGHQQLRGAIFLNLGETKTARGEHYYRSTKPPVLHGSNLSSAVNSDSTVSVTSRSQVQDSRNGADNLGALTVEYRIKKNAEILVSYELEWTSSELSLWELGIGIPVPKQSVSQSWSRESYFSAYPPGHLGAPFGACTVKDPVFRASKRFLHFLTLTDESGRGLALISSSSPLIGRAVAEPSGTVLYASREEAAAGPDDLSWSWFHAHDIHAVRTHPLTGDFVLRAVGPR